MIDFSRNGRMIGPSKSQYRSLYPDNKVYFNANLCTREQGKLWHGDLDLTRDCNDIQQFADELGQEVFVLREMDGRFGNERTPLLDRAVVSFVPSL